MTVLLVGFDCNLLSNRLIHGNGYKLYELLKLHQILKAVKIHIHPSSAIK